MHHSRGQVRYFDPENIIILYVWEDAQMDLDYAKIKKLAEGYKEDMTRFLREMISYPSESCQEKEVAQCIVREMKKAGFDRAETDGLGNAIGWIGRGGDIGDDKKIVCFSKISQGQ